MKTNINDVAQFSIISPFCHRSSARMYNNNILFYSPVSLSAMPVSPDFNTITPGHWALTFLKLSQLPGELTSPLWLPIRRSGSIHNNHHCPRRYSFTAEWTEAIGNEVSYLRTQHGAQSGN